MDEIIKGLADAGVLEMLQMYPDLFRPLFVHSQDPLTAGDSRIISSLFDYSNILFFCCIYNYIDQLMHVFEKRVFSESGSSELVKEQVTFMQFSDLLEELEGTFSLPKYIMWLVRTSHIQVILCFCLSCTCYSIPMHIMHM